MKRFIIIVLILSVFTLIIGCSGSKATDEPEVTFADPGIQDQVEDLKDKIEDNPNQTLYRKQLAELYNENGEKLEAMRTLEKAFVIDPSDGEMKYMYAEIAIELGDKLKAYRAYKDVLQSADGMTYLDRISPKFVDAFQVTETQFSSNFR